MAQYCRKCGNPLKENARFCGKCGTPVEQTADDICYCPFCMQEVSKTAAVCPHCGESLINEEQEKPIPAVSDPDKTDEKEKEAGGKKIPVWVYIISAAALLLAGIFLGRGINAPASGNDESAVETVYELQFTKTRDDGDLEVSAENTLMDCTEFATVSENGIISADPAVLDLSKPGSYTVLFTCEWPDHPEQTVTEEKTVHIIDNEPPAISVREKEISIKAGSKYDLRDNIETVYDSVDGELKYSETETAGTYTISGNSDFSKAGIYEFTVTAADISGNRSSAVFTVKTYSEQRFVAIPEGCSSKRTDYDKLFAEMDIYGKEYTSPAYSTEGEMAHALREFEKEKYPNYPCQVYPAVHIQDGDESQWIFYDYNPWDG